jgi:hypothetical protein
LINNAINDGSQAWMLDWMNNRMRYIESAENMTYDIPGNDIACFLFFFFYHCV